MVAAESLMKALEALADPEQLPYPPCSYWGRATEKLLDFLSII